MKLVEQSVGLSANAGQKTSSVHDDMQQLDANIEKFATAAEEQTTASESIARSSQILLSASHQQNEEVMNSANKVDSLQSNINALHTELTKFIT